MKILNLILLILALFLTISCSSEDGQYDEMVGDKLIYGKIVDANTGAPLQGVSVSLYPGGISYITGADGLYEFQNLVHDSYMVKVNKDGYYSTVGNTDSQNTLNTYKLDFTLKRGEPCLDVLFGSLNFEKNSMSKSFVISNKGSEPIEWNLYTDFLNLFEFDKVKGILQPQTSETVNVDISLVGVSNVMSSYPIYISTINERVGLLATVNEKSLLRNSLLVGDWTVEETRFFEVGNDDRTYNIVKTLNRQFLTMNDDYSYNFYIRGFVNNGIDDVDEMFNYGNECGTYYYDQVANILQFGEYGAVFKIKNLSKEYLELEQVLVDGNKSGEIFIFKRL